MDWADVDILLAVKDIKFAYCDEDSVEDGQVSISLLSSTQRYMQATRDSLTSSR